MEFLNSIPEASRSLFSGRVERLSAWKTESLSGPELTSLVPLGGRAIGVAWRFYWPVPPSAFPISMLAGYFLVELEQKI